MNARSLNVGSVPILAAITLALVIVELKTSGPNALIRPMIAVQANPSPSAYFLHARGNYGPEHVEGYIGDNKFDGYAIIDTPSKVLLFWAARANVQKDNAKACSALIRPMIAFDEGTQQSLVEQSYYSATQNSRQWRSGSLTGSIFPAQFDGYVVLYKNGEVQFGYSGDGQDKPDAFLANVSCP